MDGVRQLLNPLPALVHAEWPAPGGHVYGIAVRFNLKIGGGDHAGGGAHQHAVPALAVELAPFEYLHACERLVLQVANAAPADRIFRAVCKLHDVAFDFAIVLLDFEDHEGLARHRVVDAPRPLWRGRSGGSGQGNKRGGHGQTGKSTGSLQSPNNHFAPPQYIDNKTANIMLSLWDASPDQLCYMGAAWGRPSVEGVSLCSSRGRPRFFEGRGLWPGSIFLLQVWPKSFGRRRSRQARATRSYRWWRSILWRLRLRFSF